MDYFALILPAWRITHTPRVTKVAKHEFQLHLLANLGMAWFFSFSAQQRFALSRSHSPLSLSHTCVRSGKKEGRKFSLKFVLLGLPDAQDAIQARVATALCACLRVCVYLCVCFA